MNLAPCHQYVKLDFPFQMLLLRTGLVCNWVGLDLGFYKIYHLKNNIRIKLFSAHKIENILIIGLQWHNILSQESC